MSFQNVENDFDGWAAQVIDEICEEVKRAKTNSDEGPSLTKQEENGAKSQSPQRDASFGFDDDSTSVSSQPVRTTPADQKNEEQLAYNFEFELDGANEELRFTENSVSFFLEDAECLNGALNLSHNELRFHSETQNGDGTASNEHDFRANVGVENLETHQNPLTSDVESFADLDSSPTAPGVEISFPSTEADRYFMNDNFFSHDDPHCIVYRNSSDMSVKNNKTIGCSSLSQIYSFENEVTLDRIDESSSVREVVLPQSVSDSQSGFCFPESSDETFSCVSVPSPERNDQIPFTPNEAIDSRSEEIDLDAVEKIDTGVICLGSENVEHLIRDFQSLKYPLDETLWRTYMDEHSEWREEKHPATENFQKDLDLSIATTDFEQDFLCGEEFLELSVDVASKSWEIDNVRKASAFEEGLSSINAENVLEESWIERHATHVDAPSHHCKASGPGDPSSATCKHPLTERDVECSSVSESSGEEEIFQERTERVVDSYRGVCRVFEDLCVRPVAAFLADHMDFFLFMLFVSIHLLFELVELLNSATARAFAARAKAVFHRVRGGAASPLPNSNARPASPEKEEWALARAVVCRDIVCSSPEDLELGGRSLEAVSLRDLLPPRRECEAARTRAVVGVVLGGAPKAAVVEVAPPPSEAGAWLERDFLESKRSLGSNPLLLELQRSLSQPDLACFDLEESSSSESVPSRSDGSNGDGFGSREFRCAEELEPPHSSSPRRSSLVGPLDENARAMAELRLPEALGSRSTRKSSSRLSLGRRVSSIFAGWRKKDLMHCVIPRRRK